MRAIPALQARPSPHRSLLTARRRSAATMADRYAREAARIAGLALADSAGFDAVQTSCSEILADLLMRYLHEVRRSSSLLAGSWVYALCTSAFKMHMLALEMTHSDDMNNAACPFPCLLQVGAASHHYAELAGRSETNAVDVVRAAGAGGLWLVWWVGTIAYKRAAPAPVH